MKRPWIRDNGQKETSRERRERRKASKARKEISTVDQTQTIIDVVFWEGIYEVPVRR